MTDFTSKVYIYNDDFINKIYQKIEALKSSGVPLTVEEFSKFDHFHPAENRGVEIFLSQFSPPKDSLILDIGCGIGGTARYLASHGYRVYAMDILPHFIECATKITELLNLSNMIEYHVGDIKDQLPTNKFDAVVLLGVLLIISGPDIFHNMFQSLKSNSLIYSEDYYYLRSNFTQEEKELIEDYHTPGTRTMEELRSHLEGAGFEVLRMDDYSREWSEYAWNRSESFWNRKITQGDVGESEIHTYAVNSPKLLCHINHMTEEEIRRKYPHTVAAIGTDMIFSENKIMGALRVVAKKN